MRIIFTCGGTGGHINPAIAVAKLIKARRPESEILFAGADGGMEVGLVAREGFPIETVRVTNFRRGLKPRDLRNNVNTVFGLAGAVRQAGAILRRFKPDLVIGTGGYASFPTVYAAVRFRIPTAIHESNAVPGLTTSLLAREATRVMVGFPGSESYYRHPERVVVTGTPVREAFIYTKKSEAIQRLGLEGKPLVVSYWGSLGAREMNKMIAEFMALEAGEPAFNHIHATGSFGWKWMPEYVGRLGVDLEKSPHIRLQEYIYNMPEVMAAADLVICRGGASTLSEVLASATPAIIVPSPNVSDNHQEKNARVLERAGGAVVLLEKDCSGEVLYETVLRLLKNPVELNAYADALKGQAILDSTEKIYRVILEILRN